MRRRSNPLPLQFFWPPGFSPVMFWRNVFWDFFNQYMCVSIFSIFPRTSKHFCSGDSFFLIFVKTCTCLNFDGYNSVVTLLQLLFFFSDFLHYSVPQLSVSIFLCCVLVVIFLLENSVDYFCALWFIPFGKWSFGKEESVHFPTSIIFLQAAPGRVYNSNKKRKIISIFSLINV